MGYSQEGRERLLLKGGCKQLSSYLEEKHPSHPWKTCPGRVSVSFLRCQPVQRAGSRSGHPTALPEHLCSRGTPRCCPRDGRVRSERASPTRYPQISCRSEFIRQAVSGQILLQIRDLFTHQSQLEGRKKKIRKPTAHTLPSPFIYFWRLPTLHGL